MVTGENAGGRGSLERALEQILRRDKKEWGKLFERFCSELLEENGCSTHEARDPETDFVAEFQGQYYRVECRFKSKGKLSATEIRDFIERVRAGPATQVGLIMTNSVAPMTASRYLKRAAPYQVLIIDRDDMEFLLLGHDNFEDFMRRNNIWAAGGRSLHLKPARSKELQSNFEVRTPLTTDVSPILLFENNQSEYLASQASGPECVIFTPIWYRGSERSYVLEALPQEYNEEIGYAERVLKSFYANFGNTSGAAFTLAQGDWSWHGFGAKAFLDCIKNQRSRYEAARLRSFHHSETALYVDEVRMTGWRDCLFWFAAQPSTGAPSLDHISFGFMFSELPFNTRPFMRFFDSIGKVPDAYETWEGHASRHFRMIRETEIEPSGYVVEIEKPEPLVKGIIMKGRELNYRDGSSKSTMKREPEGWAGKDLARSQFWIVELLDWYRWGYRPRPKYRIRDIRTLDIPAPGFGGAIVSVTASCIFDRTENS